MLKRDIQSHHHPRIAIDVLALAPYLLITPRTTGLTHILVKANLVKIRRIGPCLIIPDVRSLDVESLRPDSVILLRSIALETSCSDVKYPVMVSDSGCPHTTSWLWRMNLQLAGSCERMSDELPFN